MSLSRLPNRDLGTDELLSLGESGRLPNRGCAACCSGPRRVWKTSESGAEPKPSAEVGRRRLTSTLGSPPSVKLGASRCSGSRRVRWTSESIAEPLVRLIPEGLEPLKDEKVRIT